MNGINIGLNLGIVSASVVSNPNTSTGLQPTICVNVVPVSVCYTPVPPGENITVTSAIVGYGYVKK